MQLSWNTGIAYDTSVLADAKRRLLMPLGATWRLVTVASFALEQSRDLTLRWGCSGRVTCPLRTLKTCPLTYSRTVQ